MTPRFCFLVALILLVSCGFARPVRAKVDVNTAAWPELSPDALLPPILAELKRTLNDPYSIRDFTLCEAAKIKLKNGKPDRWSVQFAFNAKNAYGGYAGVRTYIAVFREGRMASTILSSQFESSDGLEGLINSMVARRMATCPTVSDDKIRELMNSQSIYRQQ